jgi:hypothetical protein
LVLAADLHAKEVARHTWHSKVKEIEASSAFKSLAAAFNERLAKERSAAARYRLLTAAGMAFGLSLGRYRKEGYTLNERDAGKALTLLGLEDPKLLASLQEAEQLLANAQSAPAGIKTGINGLEM